MLVLTRRTWDVVVVTHQPSGDRITVTVCNISNENRHCRLGFEAPRETFNVARKELDDKTRRKERTQDGKPTSGD